MEFQYEKQAALGEERKVKGWGRKVRGVTVTLILQVNDSLSCVNFIIPLIITG